MVLTRKDNKNGLGQGHTSPGVAFLFEVSGTTRSTMVEDFQRTKKNLFVLFDAKNRGYE